MNIELLRTAQGNLRLLDVALRESQSSIGEKFEPGYEQPDVEIQLMQHVLLSEQLKISDKHDDAHELFRVFVRLGVRWVEAATTRARKQRKKTAIATPETIRILAQVEATFVTTYEMEQSLEQDALDEFAHHNVAWQVWPYWREYVANQAARMNLPRITLPMQCLPTDKADEEAVGADS